MGPSLGSRPLTGRTSHSPPSASFLLPGKPYGADDFLPVLMYVLARSNLTEMLLNVEYMMELMDPALQLGEGESLVGCLCAQGSIAHPQPSPAWSTLGSPMSTS